MAKPVVPPGKNKPLSLLSGALRAKDARDRMAAAGKVPVHFSIDNIVLKVAEIGTASITFAMPRQ